MKLLKLTIEKTRGIVDLTLEPHGRNALIWGPNGSGKSAVVDALDFLLTGNISRLAGPGTGELSLAKHGKHLDYEPKDAVVRAVVLLPGDNAEPVEIARSMDKAAVLSCPSTVRDEMERIERLARGHSHILTRREILRFINVEPGTRAQVVQEVLALSRVEETRQALGTAANQLKISARNSSQQLTERRSDVASAAQEKDFDTERVLHVINEKRVLLGAVPIDDLESESVQDGLDANPTAAQDGRGNDTGLLRADVEHARKILLEANVSEADSRLRQLITTVRGDPNLHHALLHLDLTMRGLDLLDDSGRCPLCDAEWSPEVLREKLEERRDRGEEARQYQSEIDEVAAAMKTTVDNLSSTIERVMEPTQRLGLQREHEELRLWRESLRTLSAALASPIDAFDPDTLPSESVCGLCAPKDAQELWTPLIKAVEAAEPVENPTVTAWKLLVRITTALEHMEKAAVADERARLLARRAEFLRNAFQDARNDVLLKLYERARDRFVAFYRTLHSEEEFMAELQPKEAALGMSVQFHDRGLHPPHAFHSEGHQDSMGLCLFLALSEVAAKGLELVILDDVVMSIDRDHRKALCRLLKQSFPDRQFLLTTHDRTWASQLVSQGIVGRTDFHEFRRWTLATGPIGRGGDDTWERIEADLVNQDAKGAAHKLRTFGEEFFEDVCDALKAKVTYKSDGQWTLADYFSGARGRIKKLLKMAKDAANSWQQQNVMENLALIESQLDQVYANNHVEESAINRAVHFNAWYEYDPNEFRDVVDAFRSVSEQFRCGSCATVLSVSIESGGGAPVGVKCGCDQVHWNLQKKKA